MKNGTAFGLMALSIIACATFIFLETDLHSPFKLLGCIATGVMAIFFAVKFIKTR